MPKFKSPDGRVFDHILKAKHYFCHKDPSGVRFYCAECPIYIQSGEFPCDPWVNQHSAEAARMIGYEIIGDDCDSRWAYNLTIEQYQQAAARTATGKCRDLANAGLGLTGEAGEVADIIKKHLYQGHNLPLDKIVEELGDLMWYVTLTASLIGVDLKDVMQANIEKLWKRYPDGFRTEDSVHRRDEDESRSNS